MKKLLFFLLVTSSSAWLHAQNFSLEDVPLTWKDFTVKENFKKHPYVAKIFSQMTYHAEYKGKEKKSILLTSRVAVDQEKSWYKKDFLDKSSKNEKQEVLNHEKGHLTIYLIQHKKLQKLLVDYKFSKKQKLEIDSLYKVIASEVNDINIRYDEETNHGRIAEKQKEWIETLLQQLNQAYAGERKIPFKFEEELTIE